jgi:hypothetical protein
MTARIAGLLSTSAVAVLAGCGGSSKSSGITPPFYRARVNKLCATGNAQIASMSRREAATAAGLGKIYAIGTQTFGEVKAVSVPRSMSAGVRSWLSVIQQEGTLAGQIIDDLTAGKIGALPSLVRKASALNAQGSSQAKALGLSSCAVNALPSG